jgi:hypothetical protein
MAAIDVQLLRAGWKMYEYTLTPQHKPMYLHTGYTLRGMYPLGQQLLCALHVCASRTCQIIFLSEEVLDLEFQISTDLHQFAAFRSPPPLH